MPGSGDTAIDMIDFEPDGDLSDATLAALRDLDKPALGAALTRLVEREATLEPSRRTVAAAAIQRAFAGTNAPFDIPALVGLYRTVMADPRRQDVARLIVLLLADTDRADVMDAIPTDSAGLDLRVKLGRALDEAQGIHARDPRATTRGIDFDTFEPQPTRAMPPQPTRAMPPLASAPPPMAAPMPADEAMAADEPMPAAAPTPTHAKPPEPAAPPAGEEAAPSPTYRAYGVLDCDELVLVGQPFALEVGLGQVPSVGVSGSPMNVRRPDAKPYNLDIQLFADGFDLAQGESWRQSLRIAKEDLFPTVVLHLTPRDMQDEFADREISATFAIEGEALGFAHRNVRVTKDEREMSVAMTPSRGASGANITVPTGEPKAHLTVTIKKGLSGGVLHWSVESEIPGVELPRDKAVESDIGEEPAAFAKAIIRKIFVHGHAVGLFQLLQGYGKRIRNEIPPEVWTAINAAAEAVKPEAVQILLLTDEPYVPWELAWVDTPYDAKAPQYLGAQANIGRWILSGSTATDPVRMKSATSMAVVWGVYVTEERLLAAEEEAKLLQKQYKATSIDAETDPVFALLGGTPPADIIHFAVHGKYDPGGAEEGIYMASGPPPIDPIQIEGSDLTGRKPFVFLNACQVGSASALLGDYSGTAQAFLAAGASAVVAPLWSVDDDIAQDIALKFYKEALASAKAAKGKKSGAGAPAETPPVADLLRRARKGLIDDAGAMSATYLAYQFYGHPSLRLSWAPETAAGEPSNG